MTDDLETLERVADVLNARLTVARVLAGKLAALQARVCPDGRLRGSLAYYGAHTGRWSGRGAQVQNFPRATEDDASGRQPEPEDVEDPSKLGGLLRGVVAAPPGKLLATVDAAQIEARVLLWLAGDEHGLQVYRDGGDPYRNLAARIFRCEEEEVTKPQRSVAKVVILACGFQGGRASLSKFAMKAGLDLVSLKLKPSDLVEEWRDAHPDVAGVWKGAITFKKGVVVDYFPCPKGLLDMWASMSDLRGGYSDARHKGDRVSLLTHARKIRDLAHSEGLRAEVFVGGAVARAKLAAAKAEALAASVDVGKSTNPDRLEAIQHKNSNARVASADMDGTHICRDGSGLWARLYKGATMAIESGKRCPVYSRDTDNPRVHYRRDGPDLVLDLPSGRELRYKEAKIEFLLPKGPTVGDPEGGTPEGKPRPTLTYLHPRYGRKSLYGGLLCENLVQATARDILAQAMVRLESAGLPVTFHVHDEIICEVERPEQLQDVVRIASESPPWAAGLPITFEGGVGKRWSK